MTENTTHFGYRNVAWEEKSHLVKGVFERVASRYDLMNDVMSFGLHRVWKDLFVNRVHADKNKRFLDVAGGTGDIALRLRRKFSAPITVCDINSAMLVEGRNHRLDTASADGLSWVCGDAQNLPFAENAYDVYTIAFGIRNVTDIAAALSEAMRVLDFGGQFLCLEFSPTIKRPIAPLYDFYSFSILPHMGKWIANDRESYQYLAESIRRFPKKETFLNMMNDAGFSRLKATPLSAGICTIFEGVKL